MERLLKRYLKGSGFRGVLPERSKIMSCIKGSHNKSTEAKLRMILIKAGIRGWVLHPNDVFGKPDIFFPKKQLAIFVDGCFWHGCPKCGHIPKTRSAFWKTKFNRNKIRAKLVALKLRQQSIKVLRIWEHAFREPYQTKRVVQIINRFLK